MDNKRKIIRGIVIKEKKSSTIIILGVVLLCVSIKVTEASEFAPSFDCLKAKNYVEKEICASSYLARLDYKLNELYQRKMASANNKKYIKEEQRRWILERNKCNNYQCVELSYKKRINSISSVNSLMPAGKRNAICDNVMSSINDGSVKNKFLSFKQISSEAQDEWMTPLQKVIRSLRSAGAIGTTSERMR